MKRRDHNGRNRFILAFLITLVMFSSCITSKKAVVSSPSTPFYLVIPTRPKLIEVKDGSIPSDVVTNMVLLMDYAEELEIYIDGMRKYYGI